MMKQVLLTLLFLSLYQTKTPESYLLEGDKAFIEKDYDLALTSYTAAVNQDSDYSRAYYKRANVYYTLQNYRKANYDLNYVINNNPDFVLAYDLMVKMKIELGLFDEALTILEVVKGIKPKKAAKYQKKVEEIDVLKKRIQEADVAFESGKFDESIQIYTELISQLPGASHLRYNRALCYYRAQQYSEVLEDTLRILKIDKKNPKVIYLRGKAFQYTDQIETAINHFTQCLKLDSFNDDCKVAKDGIESFQQDLTQGEDFIRRGRPTMALEKLQKCLDFDEKWTVVRPQIYVLMCKAYIKLKDSSKAIQYGQMIIDLEGERTDVLSLMGEAYVLAEDYEQAIRYYQKAVDGGDRSAYEGLQNAKRLDKMSKRKDYYKILGVEKTASDRDIKQAFRKKAMKYHPDKVRTNDEEERERINKLYLDINEANEVLSDHEKRGKYDRGEDLEERQGHPGGGFHFNFGGDFGQFFRGG